MSKTYTVRLNGSLGIRNFNSLKKAVDYIKSEAILSSYFDIIDNDGIGFNYAGQRRLNNGA